MSFHAVVPPPRTILNGIRKIAAGDPPHLRARRAHQGSCLLGPEFGRTSDEITCPRRSGEERVGAALRKAVERRMVADVPVGVLLSGGVDSSLVVALLAEAGQQGSDDLLDRLRGGQQREGRRVQFSDMVAERYGTRHHKIFIESDRLMDALPGTIRAMSEPMVSYDNVGFYLLSQEVSKHIKVVQSGQGADEMFAGYHWYPPLMSSNDVAADYARVFFDRSDERLRSHISPMPTCPRRPSFELVAEHLGRAWRKRHRSIAACGSTPPSCWPTIRSSVSTT
jgi:asparagine synthase (glutamine-hydrolysing)